jgi:hypothetical protein
MLATQLDLGEWLAQAIGAEALTPARYRRWLCLERTLLRTTAHALAAIDGGIAPHEPFRHWWQAQSVALRDAEAAVAIDLRALGVDDSVSHPGVQEHCRDWTAAPLAYPHRVAGAAALLDAAMGGAARDAIAAVLGLGHVGVGCSHYLAHRQQQLSVQMPWRRHALERIVTDAATGNELALGARRAADTYRVFCGALLREPPRTG